MPTIRLKSPSGEVREVDPDEYDVPAMLESGFARDSGKVAVRPHERNRPKRKEPFLVSQIPNVAGALGDIGGRAVGGAIGAVAGAPAGGVGAIPGAAIGQEAGGILGGSTFAAGGEALRQGIGAVMGVEGGPQTPQERAQAVVDAGGAQAAYSAVGGVLAKGAGIGGKAAMKAALRWTPETAQTAIREGIGFTAGGLKKIGAKLGEYSGQLRKMLTVSEKAGTKYDPVDVLKNAMTKQYRGQPSLYDQMLNNQSGDQSAVREQINEQIGKLFKRHGVAIGNGGQIVNGSGKPLGPLALQKLKQDAQDIAEPIFEMMADKEKVALVQPSDKVKAQVYRAVADAAQELLEVTTPQDVINGRHTSVAELNAAQRSLIELKQVISPKKLARAVDAAEIAVKRGAIPVGVGATVGALQPGDRMHNAQIGAMTGAAMSTPANLSRLALLLSSPGAQNVIRYAPRAFGALMEEPR